MPAGELRYPSPVLNSSSMETPSYEEEVWAQIKAEAKRDAESEPALASYLYSTILSHSSLERSLSFHLGNKLCSSTLLSTLLYDLFLNTFSSDPSLRAAAVADLRAARVRDPACVSFSHCLLNYKGFLACQVIFIYLFIFNCFSLYENVSFLEIGFVLGLVLCCLYSIVVVVFWCDSEVVCLFWWRDKHVGGCIAYVCFLFIFWTFYHQDYSCCCLTMEWVI